MHVAARWKNDSREETGGQKYVGKHDQKLLERRADPDVSWVLLFSSESMEWSEVFAVSFVCVILSFFYTQRSSREGTKAVRNNSQVTSSLNLARPVKSHLPTLPYLALPYLSFTLPWLYLTLTLPYLSFTLPYLSLILPYLSLTIAFLHLSTLP